MLRMLIRGNTVFNRYVRNVAVATAWKVFVFGLFMVSIFPYSDWILRDRGYLSVFCSNAGKDGPEKL